MHLTQQKITLDNFTHFIPFGILKKDYRVIHFTAFCWLRGNVFKADYRLVHN